MTQQRSSLVDLVTREPSTNSPKRAPDEAFAVVGDVDIRDNVGSTDIH